MATWRDVSRYALALPDTNEETSTQGLRRWNVRKKMFAWERPLRRSDLEALGEDAPKGAILGLWTVDLEMKEMLLASDSRIYFTTPHFNGYTAVLVRLAVIPAKLLRDALVEAWLARAPGRLAESYLARAGSPRR